MHLSVVNMHLSVVLSFLEYLVVHGVSVHMVANYLSALKAMFVAYHLFATVFDHQQAKYFIRAIKIITRPVSVAAKNVMDIPTLQRLIQLAGMCKHGITYKAISRLLWFLLAFQSSPSCQPLV